jgi:hypothetical protein
VWGQRQTYAKQSSKTKPLTMLVQVMRNQPQGAMEEGKKSKPF